MDQKNYEWNNPRGEEKDEWHATLDDMNHKPSINEDKNPLRGRKSFHALLSRGS